MKRVRIILNWRKIRRIPLRAIVLWVLFFSILVFCAARMITHSNYTHDNMESTQIEIEKVFLTNTFSTKGSRMKLTIQSGETQYYLWYPPESYLQYSDAINTYLLSGNVTHVSAIVVSDSTIWDSWTGRQRIIDLRMDNTVFYEFDTEASRLQGDYATFCVLTLLIGFFHIIYTIIVCIVYGVVNFRKK